MNAIIATTPQAMQEAGRTTLQWVVDRLDAARRELALAEQTFVALQRAKASWRQRDDAGHGARRARQRLPLRGQRRSIPAL